MTIDIDTLWRETYAEQIEEDIRETGIPITEWRTGGRRTKQWPNGQDHDYWLETGPELIQNYIQWREGNPDLKLWITPEGEPAVELGMTVKFGEIPVTMYIDAVFEFHGGLLVIDTKSGTRTPESELQLGFYATGVEIKYGRRPAYGGYFMARKGALSTLEPLDKYSLPLMSKLCEHFVREVEGNGAFLPNPAGHCKQCGVRDACAIMGGELAHLYDPLHPNYHPIIKDPLHTKENAVARTV